MYAASPTNSWSDALHLRHELCRPHQLRNSRLARFSISYLQQVMREHNSFDLVNVRFIFAFMPPAACPQLVDECVRITRPGGIIRLTETEWNLTNSLAYETLHAMTARALKKAGKSFSPDGRNVGITPVLGQFLQQAHCEHIQHAAYALDLSAGTEAHGSMYQNSMAFFRLIEPFLLNMQVTTQEEFEELYNRMLAEVLSDTFRAISFILTAWGQTPS